MAGPVLQATARLNDGVSSTLRNMITQTNALMTQFERMDRVMRNLGTGNRGVRQLTQELEASNRRIQRLEQRANDLAIRFRTATQQVTAMGERLSATEEEVKGLIARVEELEKKMEEITGHQKKFKVGISNTNSSMRQLLSTVMSIATIYAGIRTAKWVMGESDQYVSTQARLEMINDNLRTQEELQNAIFNAARRSRAEYDSFAESTAKLGLLAGDAFANNDELIYFMETMQKAFKVSGASASESINAMYQLTQAMAAGKLQGDEFRSIMENAPMLADSIEQYMKNAGVKGVMKDWSRDGLITSDVIKAALFNAADDINTKFATLPMTFGDLWNQMGTTATQIFAPLWERINGSINDSVSGERFNGITQTLYTAAIYANNFFTQMQLLGQSSAPLIVRIKNEFGDVAHSIFSANGLLGTMTNTLSKMARSKGAAQFFTILAKGANGLTKSLELAIGAFGWMSENFQLFLPILGSMIVGFTTFKIVNGAIHPIVMGVSNGISLMHGNMTALTASTTAATAAQNGLNLALKANPYIFVASAIMSVVVALNALGNEIFKVNKIAGLASSSTAIGGISYEAIQRSKQTGESYATSQAKIDNEKQHAEIAEEQRKIIEKNEKKIARLEAKEKDKTSTYWQYENREKDQAMIAKHERELSEARANKNKAQAAISQSWVTMRLANNELTNMEKAYQAVQSDIDSLMENDISVGDDTPTLENIAADTSRIADSVDISKENLQYMRDNAERETINRFTTAEIKVDMTNNNNITNQNDVDGLMTAFGIRLREELDATAERSYQF